MTIFEVIRILNQDIKSAFFFEKRTQTELIAYAYQRLSYLTRTDSGNLRFAKKDVYACKAVINNLIENLLTDFTVYCYQIDGELYTTYNSEKPFKYNFKGDTKSVVMKNYKLAGKETRLLELSKNNNNVVSGFYYPCGKPFYINKV